MENDASLQTPGKMHPPGKEIVVVLLVLHGTFLIIIGLIAFFGGFVGIYDVTNGHTTPDAIFAVLGIALAWIFLLGGIVSFLCAQGLLTWQRWALWLTIGLEITNLIVGCFALKLRLFAPWIIILSMSIAGGILLYALVAIGTHMLTHSE